MGEEETAANETSDSMRDLVFMLERFGESIPPPPLRSYGVGKNDEETKLARNRADVRPHTPKNWRPTGRTSHMDKITALPLYLRRIRRNTPDEP
jgi:hypothetical protein